MLSYEEWVLEYGEEIDIELAENGADRELDFDLEDEYEFRYLAYCDTYQDGG